LQVFREDNRLSKIMLMIRGIDRDRNGYVTTSEMDDILKEVYPDQFAKKDLKPHLKVFTSI
jgi:Ca2+-binding EF-hand superfamily protein